MKFRAKAILVFEWEDDTDNWKNRNEKELSVTATLERMQEYLPGDLLYILDENPTSVKIEALNG